MAATIPAHRVRYTIARPRRAAAVPARWWMHLLWVAGAGVLGFAIAALFAGVLHLPRALFLVPYVALSLAFLALYVRWARVDILARTRQHWGWGVLGAVLVGAFTVRNVLGQPSSAVPSGLELAGAILWFGVAYGTVDALLLSVLPLFATWRALALLGRTSDWRGKVASGVLAMFASLAVAALYHLGFPEYRGAGLVQPLIGNGVFSLGSLLTMNPIAAVVGHIAMHTSAVLHGMETAAQLPPHYGF